MIAYFPQPYEDELLYSLIARYHRLSGNVLARDTMLDLFGNKNESASIILPARIGILAHNAGQSLNKLLFNCTLFPFHAAFIRQKIYERIVKWAENGEPGSVHAMLGLYGQGIRQPSKLRFCPKCIHEEIKVLGEGYWHRFHQIPGVLICEKHCCTLAESTVSYTTYGANQYLPANLNTIFPAIIPRMLTAKECLCAEAINKDIQWLLFSHSRVRRVFMKHKGSFAKLFLYLLKERDLATYGSLKIKKYKEAFDAFFCPGYLEKLGLDMENGTKIAWIIRICRSGKIPTNPLKYILLSQFLCGSMESLIELADVHDPESLNISPFYCSTVINEDEKRYIYRDKWMTARQGCHNGCQNDIRKRVPSVYTWLIRHDKAWLKDNSPTPKKRGGNKIYADWKAQDRELAQKIKCAAEKIKAMPGKPIQISVASIGRILGCEGLIRAKKKKLPKTMEALAGVVEDKHAFRIRRICWAIDELKRKNITVSMWRVMRLAGIRDERGCGYWEHVIIDELKRNHISHVGTPKDP